MHMENSGLKSFCDLKRDTRQLDTDHDQSFLHVFRKKATPDLEAGLIGIAVG